MRLLIDIFTYYCVAVMVVGVLFQFWKGRLVQNEEISGASRKWYYHIVELLGIVHPVVLGVSLIQVLATLKAIMVHPFTRRAPITIKAPNKNLAVVNGSMEWGTNHSLIEIAQTWALDMTVLHDRKTHSADNGCNLRISDFYTYGLEVFSPVDGRVVRVRNNTNDRKWLFGCVWPFVRSIWGNYVEIDSTHGRLLFAHLEKGSVSLLKGDEVSVGTFLGRVGNSGLSSEPHLHMQCHTRGGRYFGHPIKMNLIYENN